MKYPLNYYIILFCHYILILLMCLGWMSNNVIFVSFVLVILIYVLILFIVCDGCIITKIEREYTKNKPTKIDKYKKKIFSNYKRFAIYKFIFFICLTVAKLIKLSMIFPKISNHAI